MQDMIIAVRCVPRIQHMALFASLREIEKAFYGNVKIYLRGSFTEEVLSFLDMFETDNWHVERAAPQGSGMDMYELLRGVTHVINQYGLEKSKVLFLDDDAVITSDQVRSLERLTSDYFMGIGLQSGMQEYIKEAYFDFAFDPFCTMVKASAPMAFCLDRKACDLLGRMNSGAEFLFLDWWFTHELKMRPNVLADPVLHLYKQDTYKLWGTWSPEEWMNISSLVRDACKFSSVCTILSEFDLVDGSKG